MDLQLEFKFGAVYAMKALFTVAIWKIRMEDISLLLFLELASYTLTEWLITIAACTVLGYTRRQFEPVGCTTGGEQTRPTVVQIHINQASSTVIGADGSQDGLSISAKTTSTRTSVIRRQTQIHMPIDKFLQTKDYQSEADRGRAEGLDLLDTSVEIHVGEDIIETLAELNVCLS